MPNDEDQNFQTLQEQIEYLMAQVTALKVNSIQYLSGFGSSVMNGFTTTTLSAAITSLTQTSITVASGAGISNPSSAGIDYLLIDNEIVAVMAGGGTTSLTIARAQYGTLATTHANGALADNTLVPITIPHPLNHIPKTVIVDSSFVEASASTYIGICHGIFNPPSSITSGISGTPTNFKGRMIYEAAVLQSGSAVWPPQSITVLAAAITTTTQTTITVSSGTYISNGQYIQLGSESGEIMQVISGGGTTTLTVVRGMYHTTPTTFLNSTPVYNAPVGYVIYFYIGTVGYCATMSADTKNIYLFCTQIGSGIAATVNFTVQVIG